MKWSKILLPAAALTTTHGIDLIGKGSQTSVYGPFRSDHLVSGEVPAGTNVVLKVNNPGNKEDYRRSLEVPIALKNKLDMKRLVPRTHIRGPELRKKDWNLGKVTPSKGWVPDRSADETNMHTPIDYGQPYSIEEMVTPLDKVQKRWKDEGREKEFNDWLEKAEAKLKQDMEDQGAVLWLGPRGSTRNLGLRNYDESKNNLTDADLVALDVDFISGTSEEEIKKKVRLC